MESGLVRLQTPGRALSVCGWGAGIAFALAAIGFAETLPGYAHGRDPVALLGSAVAPHALAFNLMALVLPGLALAAFALVFERAAVREGGGRLLRIATGLLLISGLAFAAQGAFPFDPRDLDGLASRRHALAWSLALLAWLASAPLLALAITRAPRWPRKAALGILLWIVALIVLGVPRAPDTAGLWQRALLAVYFLWPALLSLRAWPVRGGG